MSKSILPGMMLCDGCGIDYPEQDCVKPFKFSDSAYCPGCSTRNVMECPSCSGADGGCAVCRYTGMVVPAECEGWPYEPSCYEQEVSCE